MKTKSLKCHIFRSFLAVIAVFAVSIAIFGYYVIHYTVIQRAQLQVKNNLHIAEWVYASEIEKIKRAFNLITPSQDLGKLKRELGLDYLSIYDRKDVNKVKSEIVLKAFDGIPAAGTRIIKEDELKSMGPEIYERCRIKIKSTLKAKPSEMKYLKSAMAIGYAKPLFGPTGEVAHVLYGGKIINYDSDLVDRIRDFVFENQLYDGKPVGTVTIFLDDVRITTNVLDQDGRRAIGTRVSEDVYQKVVEKGIPWLDRAFVVTDWYLTAYEPIRNIKGEVIGILYVGTLEKPFYDIKRNIFLGFLAIVIVASLLAAILAFVLNYAILKPFMAILAGISKISKGDLDYRVESRTSIAELDGLAESFNEMAHKLHEHDMSLKVSADRMTALNKSYLDLVSFVTHELKAIMASTILNAYMVRDGFLGMINFKQRKALDAVARNLDYFDSTVKNFLDLSRIEKGEMVVRSKIILIKEDVFDVSVDAFLKQASEKNLSILNRVEPGLKVKGDLDLLRVVANNLIGNAVKYGRADGAIILSSKKLDHYCQIEIYNDGVPIALQEKDKLFKKFSRLDSSEAKKASGTGLGLYVTREIIEKHNGKLWFEPRNAGNSFIFEIERGE
jgi:signal transduction histidine kinase